MVPFVAFRHCSCVAFPATGKRRCSLAAALGLSSSGRPFSSCAADSAALPAAEATTWVGAPFEQAVAREAPKLVLAPPEAAIAEVAVPVRPVELTYSCGGAGGADAPATVPGH